jgi:uncharacterized protein YcbX
MTRPYLSQLFVYPVKSCAGIRVEQWPVVETGLLYDRKWMLIDANQQFLSQRTLPKMALIQPTLTAESVILSAPGMSNIQFPLNSENGETIASQVWHDTCRARVVSAEVDAWVSEFLQTPCRLVYQPLEAIRAVDSQYAHASDQVSFADGFPFLILSESSLNALNQKANLDLTMARFRPNLVIADCEAYAEDSWRGIRIGEIDFRLPKPCSRCAVPGIDPHTAQSSKAPLQALNQFRRWQGKIYFGQNALHDQLGTLQVGDKVVVTQIGHAQPPLS